MLNIIVPMAGAGSRFASAGYIDPKPLISINGIPMIHLVIQNLTPETEHRFIFICQQSHIDNYGLVEKLTSWAPGCELVGLDGLTEGAACTVLAVERWIDNDSPLMIANSDQYIDMDINSYLDDITARQLDGLIMTMEANDPKWSFVGMNNDGLVTRVVEKEVISNEATVGIYNFKHGRDFVSAAKEMIAQDIRVNNEFYVAPTYNQLIKNGMRIGCFNIGSEANGMYGLGTPADLNLFIKNSICTKATTQS